MPIWTEYLKMFLTGFSYGAGPCLLSCAPVLLPILIATITKQKQGIAATVSFATGRIIAYLILGWLAGWSIRLLELFQHNAFPPAMIRILAAGIVIITGLLIIIGRNVSDPYCGRFIKYFIDKNHKSVFILGILLGFAPCFPLIGVLTYIAVKAASPWQGMIYAGCFGLGNMIIVLLLGVLSSRIIVSYKQEIKIGQKILIKVCGIFLIIWGVLLTFKT